MTAREWEALVSAVTRYDTELEQDEPEGYFREREALSRAFSKVRQLAP